MKASIRHLLTLPSAVVPSSELTLKDRILKSTAPLPTDPEDDGGALIGNGHQRNKSHSSASSIASLPKREIHIDILDVHPSEPILCFVTYPESVSVNAGHHQHGHGQTKILGQIIVVQNYVQNKIIDQISLMSIVNALIAQRNENGNLANRDQAVRQACLDLGSIVSVQFMDPQVLFYHSGRPDYVTKDICPVPYIIVQFTQTIILYKHNNTSIQTKGASSIVEITQGKLNNALPTSKPIPILSINLLAIGCSDGAMRFYSVHDKKVVKSVRGPNGKLDPVVGIVAVHPWLLYSNEVPLSSVEQSIKVATVCASGTAYIWELQVSFQPSGKVHDFKIRSPLVKLDLYRFLRQSSPTFLSHKMDKFKVKFDADRDLLYWTFQSGSTGKIHVLVWDWNEDVIQRTSQKKVMSMNEIATKKLNDTPLYRPCKIIEVPLLEDSHPFSLTNVVAGLVHPSFSELSAMILVISDNGDMYIVGGKCKDEHKKNKLQPEEGVLYYKFVLSSLKKSATVKALGNMRFADSGKLKVLSATVSRSRPDFVILNTNMGLLIINLLLDDETLLAGSHHVLFPCGRGNGLITVEHSNVYASIIDDKNTLSWNGKVTHENKVLVYESPPPLHKTLEFQSRPVRMPPRMLLSPSGNFLCLFWYHENRYEILHMDSLTESVRKSQKEVITSRLSPAVDTGFDVLSFAWIGDDDVFALLYPPELTKDKDNQIVKTKAVLDVLGSPRLGKQDEDDKIVTNDPDKFKPRVELKILVGVNADAADFSGSLAAATAKYLGTINLRGRHPPRCLFGGPVLCIGSLSQDDDTSQRDGISHFYCLSPSATDNLASSYISVGPALPYPDFVVWDDDGGLCAIIVERRIAIYTANASNFTLCGTSYLGTDHESDCKVQSAKFILGVLYCATEKSIQCIFLGDFENDKVTCTTNSFIIASSSVDRTRFCGYSISPPAEHISLMWPALLGYHQGNLLVSSTNGVTKISLASPLLRIGILLSADQAAQAQKWIDAVHPSQHIYLANFLSCQGYLHLAITLSGLSIETRMDICKRFCSDEYLQVLEDTFSMEKAQLSSYMFK